MVKNKEMKPLKMWWIWALYGLLVIYGIFFNLNPDVIGGVIWLPVLLSIMIYSFNVKKFGKKYWKKNK